MGLKRKFENKLLSRSNSYQFYKNYYENSIKNPHKNSPEIEKQFTELKQEFDLYKENTDRYMDSSTYLLRTLLLDYELNESKGILKYIQDLSYELLIFITSICTENKINWWIDSSTLLGASRHRDFIPWDDEVDIGMMRKDYNEFLSIINDKILQYGLDDILTVEFKDCVFDDVHFNSFIRILIKSKVEIDEKERILTALNVFSYDFVEKYGKTKKKFEKTKIRFIKNLKSNVDRESCLKDYFTSLKVSIDETDYIIPSIESKYLDDESDKIFIFKTENIFPLEEIKLRNNVFHSPRNAHYYLKRMYKDYFNLPRIVAIHDKVDGFRYNTNNDALFNEFINRLHEVNSKF